MLVELSNKNIDKKFIYSVPKDLEKNIKLGIRVEVPFGNQTLEGFILEIKEDSNLDFAMVNLLGKLDDIKNRAKKIGVEQRMFFTYFFRELFNPNSDSYLDMNSAIESGFNKYISLI